MKVLFCWKTRKVSMSYWEQRSFMEVSLLNLPKEAWDVQKSMVPVAWLLIMLPRRPRSPGMNRIHEQGS